jgi:hypothetical protein
MSEKDGIIDLSVEFLHHDSNPSNTDTGSNGNLELSELHPNNIDPDPIFNNEPSIQTTLPTLELPTGNIPDVVPFDPLEYDLDFDLLERSINEQISNFDETLYHSDYDTDLESEHEQLEEDKTVIGVKVEDRGEGSSEDEVVFNDNIFQESKTKNGINAANIS